MSIQKDTVRKMLSEAKKGYKNLEAKRIILGRIDEGIEEYEKDIKNMPDDELIKFVNDDFKEDDFATKELIKKRLKTSK